MKEMSLLFLRVSLGLLLVWWGVDKIVDVEHALAISENFYLGLLSAEWLLRGLGAGQTLLGLVVVLGAFRSVAYPLMVAVNAASGLAVWRSIVDPWGWVFEGTNALFYPSLIILAGCLVVWAFTEEDVHSLDARRARAEEAPAPAG